MPPGLEELYCCLNKFTALRNLPAGIRILFCSENKITLIEYPPNLEILQCGFNLLESVNDIPSTVITLVCNNNKLTNLDVLPPNLEYLCAYTNPFIYEYVSDPTLENVKLHNETRNGQQVKRVRLE